METPGTVGDEKRRHTRLPSIVPIDYQLLNDDGEPLDSDIRTAFTRDLSEEGLCLTVTRLPEALAGHLDTPATPLRITVDIRLPKRTLRVSGKVAWCRKESQRDFGYAVGVQFLDVKGEDGAAIDAFARRAARRPKIVKAVTATLVIALVLSAGAYALLSRRYQKDMARSEREVVAAHAARDDVADSAGDMRVELRWLTAEVDEIIEMVAENRGALAGETTEEGGATPVMEELTRNIGTLKKLVAQRRAARAAAAASTEDAGQ